MLKYIGLFIMKIYHIQPHYDIWTLYIKMYGGFSNLDIALRNLLTIHLLLPFAKINIFNLNS